MDWWSRRSIRLIRPILPRPMSRKWGVSETRTRFTVCRSAMRAMSQYDRRGAVRCNRPSLQSGGSARSHDNVFNWLECLSLAVDRTSVLTGYADFGAEVGGEIWDHFTVHYTPSHGSWLNQAKIEIGMFARQCLGKRRIPTFEFSAEKPAPGTAGSIAPEPRSTGSLTKKPPAASSITEKTLSSGQRTRSTLLLRRSQTRSSPHHTMDHVSRTDHGHHSARSRMSRRRRIPGIRPNNNDLGNIAANDRTRLSNSTRNDDRHKHRHSGGRLRTVSG